MTSKNEIPAAVADVSAVILTRRAWRAAKSSPAGPGPLAVTSATVVNLADFGATLIR